MYEATFRIRGGDQPIPTAGLDVRVDLWCNDHADLIRAGGQDASAVIAEIDEFAGVADRMSDGDEHLAVTEDCLASGLSDNIEQYLGRHDCLLLPPLRYAEGERICRVLAFDGGALSDLYRDLLDDGQDVRVGSKRRIRSVSGDTPMLDPAGLVPDFTARQRDVLQAAIERGYYEIPRETTTAEVARAVGVERRTAEDHLRRAERKLVATLSEFV